MAVRCQSGIVQPPRFLPFEPAKHRHDDEGDHGNTDTQSAGLWLNIECQRQGRDHGDKGGKSEK